VIVTTRTDQSGIPEQDDVKKITSVERALRAAEPHLLLTVVRIALTEEYGAEWVELRMADYGLKNLQAVQASEGAEEAVPLHDSPEGRAFGAQEPHVVHRDAAGVVDVHLPVTIRGDRLGVLSVRLPVDRYAPAVVADLEHICQALGHEILVAERDTDLYLMARRAARLTLAAEMQWQLLPGRSCTRTEFSLGAQLEPAYAIYGDNFDWSASSEHLTVTVTNGMGQGIEAALLSNLAVNALRNARRAGLSLADQAILADQAVYAQYGGRAHVAVLLMRFELATGEVEVVEAGSPRVWRRRGRQVEELTFDAQLPLGMFDGTVYVPERFTVEPGDRLLFASDGVYESVSPAQELFTERALARALAATGLLPAAQVPGAILRAVADHRGDSPLGDDALVLCLDWRGRPAT
jgi:serine phosphatase RsbU (regulator of sigma subunit)